LPVALLPLLLNVQVSDTTGDAMKNNSPASNFFHVFHYSIHRCFQQFIHCGIAVFYTAQYFAPK